MVYTFGEPRIGNERLAQTINKELTIYRVVYEDDPIPHMPPRKCLFQNGGYFHPGIEVFYSINGNDKQKITVCAGDNINCTSNHATIALNFNFDICDHMRYPDLDRIFQFGECEVTSKCKNNFDMGISKQGEYASVLKFVFNTLKDIISGDGLGCDPVIQTPEQLQCDQGKGRFKAVQNLPDFKWVVADSVLDKFEGKYILLRINNSLMLLANLLRNKRREGQFMRRNLLLLKRIFDQKSNLDSFIKLSSCFCFDFVFKKNYFWPIIIQNSEKGQKSSKRQFLQAKGSFKKLVVSIICFFPAYSTPKDILIKIQMSKLLVLLFAVLALASAGCSCYKKKPFLGYEFTIAKVAAQYASCSCVTNEYINNIQSWFYDPCREAQSKDNIEDVYVVQSQAKYNLLAYVAHDKVRNWNVVSFRATICGHAMANVRLDADFLLKNYREHGCERKDCKMHQGFMNGYNNLVKNGLLDTVRHVYNNHKNAKWLVTGISLGAALAAIGAYDISQYLIEENLGRPDMMVYTFGEPRIGNQKLAEVINSQLTIYRVVLEKDPVPHMPPRKSFLWNGGFYHPGIEVFYPLNGDSSQEITICAGDNSECASNKATVASGFKFEPCNHMQYPDVERVYDFGKGDVTSKCKDSFDMGRAKRSEYWAVLAFAKRLLFDRKNIKCPGLHMPEQLKCDEFKTSPDVSNNLPDFRWIVPDSILEKFEGQIYPPSEEKIIEVVDSLLEDERKRVEAEEEKPSVAQDDEL